jgi:hypothetical protein
MTYSGKLMLGICATALASAMAWTSVVMASAPAAPGAAAAPATPMVNGKPYLGGVWNGPNPAGGGGGGGGTGGGLANDPTTGPLFAGRGGSFYGFEEDAGLRRAMFENKPIYKPEFWEKVNDLDYWANWEDPDMQCLPLGLPRIGFPVKIVHVPDENQIILFYQNKGTTRTIPTDGRPHDPARVSAETWYGHPVGKWDGNTLVIETIGFTDASWMHVNGYPHGFNMRITERYTRAGNSIRMEMVVEDPEYLQQPWIPAPVTRYLNPDPKVVALNEDLPCLDRDLKIYASHTRS